MDADAGSSQRCERGFRPRIVTKSLRGFNSLLILNIVLHLQTEAGPITMSRVPRFLRSRQHTVTYLASIRWAFALLYQVCKPVS